MKKYLIIVAALLVMGLTSCHKTRYCKCVTIQNDQTVELGSDYYTIEDEDVYCPDRAREIEGWGQVVCVEVSEYEATGVRPAWWDHLFHKN